MGLEAISAWREYGWLRAGFSTREGGTSAAYGPGELNLGRTGEDTPEAVTTNRSALVAAAGCAQAMTLVTARQVHGRLVQNVAGDGPWEQSGGRAVLEGDGLMTIVPGLLLGILTADCVPVLLADVRLRVVAALHAGWRGTVARIAEAGVQSMARAYGSRPEDMVAAIGPAIRSCCFAVGGEVAQTFTEEFAYADELLHERSGRPHIDLQAANLRQLTDAGVLLERVTMLAECTACARTATGGRKYFSHRAEGGVTGRMMSVIGTVYEIGIV